MSESQQSRKCLEIHKGLSPLTRQQQLKVGEKHRAFCIIYTSSTTHFINVNLTKSMSNAIEYIVEREKLKITGFTKPGFVYIRYSQTS